MKGARLVRPRRSDGVNYFDVVEFQWSNVSEIYYVNLGVIVPAVSEAMGINNADGFTRWDALFGDHRLGDSRPWSLGARSHRGWFLPSPDGDAEMRLLLEQQALPWFDRLVLPKLARSSERMGVAHSIALLYLLGEREDALARLGRPEEDMPSDPRYAHYMTIELERARAAVDHLSKRPPDE